MSSIIQANNEPTRASVRDKLEDAQYDLHHMGLLIDIREHEIKKKMLELEGRKSYSEPLDDALLRKNKSKLDKLDDEWGILDTQAGYIEAAENHIKRAMDEINDEGWPQ